MAEIIKERKKMDNTAFTKKQLKNFISEFGVKEDEPLDILLEDDPEITENDPEMMINLGYFWHNKYKLYFAKNNSVYSEMDEIIVKHLLDTKGK